MVPPAAISTASPVSGCSGVSGSVTIGGSSSSESTWISPAPPPVVPCASMTSSAT